MKTPDTRSFTMLCIPKANVTATTEVPATSVVMLKPISAKIIRRATRKITKLTALLAKEPSDSMRCLRRSADTVVASISFWAT
jgi:hypothetical protein